ncbi:hypothetical protein EAL2_c14500 [Peptoclostridium acidaminophilum DSM 3953]|uniref:Uncharacterized protein n=1 Tax=Peptoclostridium acidaminophilum DSM 3953 TaxID=1286171 RepID=W8T799_PEPAC|nr:hypothetical protein [Peptoclostridium acidaminophilum]AHM56745.1 hypothetical protein EAL2_c14500 [Peptoclostridium acidaminophilum DSM 3953]
MNRISGIGGDRIKIFDVERKTVSGSVRDVDAIKSVGKVKNETANAGQNYTIESDTFYEHLKKAKKSMDDFSVSEYSIKKQIRDTPGECDDLYGKIVEAINNINSAIKTIKVMDSFAGGYGFKKVAALSDKYSHIAKLGISFMDSKFVIDEKLLRQSLENGTMSAETIFDPELGLLKKVHSILENAKTDIINFLHGSGGLFDKKL